MDSVKYTDVLIVGAGPSGLMMAAQLLRFGIQPVIIDAKPGPDRMSKAIAVHARSLELLRQMGLADQLLAQGAPCYGLQLQGQKTTLGKLDFSQMDSPNTAFPFIHIIGQDKTEKLLIDRLTEKACPVRWETRLVSLQQDDNMASVELMHQNTIQKWECKWVIGADGTNSTVRDSIGVSFEGRSYNGYFFLADVQIDGPYKRFVHFFLSKKGFLGIFPYGVSGQYRLFGRLPKNREKQSLCDIQYADIKPAIDEVIGFELPVSKSFWINRFLLHKRMAEQFARQRCFLIGDAAHIHSPIGGQGMNSGMQDAANLAWKLAGVINGRMDRLVLHSYEQERVPVARATLRATSRAFAIISAMPPWLAPLRDALLSLGLYYINKKTARLGRFFDRIAQLDIHYRKAPLAIHHATGRGVQAGDRLPFLPIFDEKTKSRTDLHRWCEKPGFVLLLLGTISQHQLHVIGQWVRQKYPREMHLYYLPYSAKNNGVFSAFDVKADGTKIILVRPDMHIGYVNDMLNVSLIDTYMEGILGWKNFGHLSKNH
ncbi:FAD-dependent oxidoreductase [Parapedobacter koreensis]|uniref:2-polyprenyl-6-methoxyphenol hydroxylase n=1 Tax=Parapedobacter koreensis TaxID=332977 RepID=A0A1H7Q607_9SPHI|nr:FAD-dependent monooxygenase [Parapedobacter koreensis]SEL43104.1 2-polyprenyl-6-methoxyphenol hydroxylase [Parapedobacter koreensis]